MQSECQCHVKIVPECQCHVDKAPEYPCHVDKAPDQISRDNSDRLKQKTCDRFCIRRVASNNRIHPIVTIYNSSGKVEPKFRESQRKRKGYFRKRSKMPKTISDNILSVDSALTETPMETLQIPTRRRKLSKVSVLKLTED